MCAVGTFVYRAGASRAPVDASHPGNYPRDCSEPAGNRWLMNPFDFGGCVFYGPNGPEGGGSDSSSPSISLSPHGGAIDFGPRVFACGTMDLMAARDPSNALGGTAGSGSLPPPDINFAGSGGIRCHPTCELAGNLN